MASTAKLLALALILLGLISIALGALSYAEKDAEALDLSRIVKIGSIGAGPGDPFLTSRGAFTTAAR